MIKTTPQASFHTRTRNGEWECHLNEIQLWTCQAIFKGGPCMVRQTGRETVSTIIELALDVAAIWLPYCRWSTKGTPSGFRSSRLKFADWRYVCSGWASQLPLGRRASREPIMLQSACARSGLSDQHTYVLPSLERIALLILDKLVILYTTLATPFLLSSWDSCDFVMPS